MTFRTTLDRSVYVESLGSGEGSVLATDLSALAVFAGDSYFSPGVPKRLLVVLTDGESRPIGPGLATLGKTGIRTLFIHLWRAGESIWQPSGAEPEYRPDPASKGALAQAARLVEGAVFDENEVAGVAKRAREVLGEGPTRVREQRDLIALMPYVTLAMLAPFAYLMRQRPVAACAARYE